MKIRPLAQIVFAALLLSILNSPSTVCRAQGALTPPGAPAPLMKSLDQVEPRTPISGQVILTNSGSYYLTTNIIANSGYGIIVYADNVSIDLCGFTLDGGPNPSAVGIFVNTLHTNFTVYNGSIRNWGSTGIDASNGTGNRIESLKIIQNKGAGLLSGTLSQVRGCSVSFNNGDGIVLGPNSAAVDCIAIANNGRGIVVQDNCSIKNTSLSANINGGIFTGLNCLVSQCIAVSNINNTGDLTLGKGIVVSNTTSVLECVVGNNSGIGITLGDYCTVRGCNVFHNAGAGIIVGNNCSVLDNNSDRNSSSLSISGPGIAVYGSANRIDGNIVRSNNGIGIVVSAGIGNLLVRNTSVGHGENYAILSSNIAGAFLSPGSGIDSNNGQITNSNPWANFSR